MKAEWIISDMDSSGDIEESGKDERKRLRASLQFSTSAEEQNIASMFDRGWDVERITDLYLTRRPARVRIEGLHQGWLTAGGEVESLDRFLARLVADGQKLAIDRKQPTLITDSKSLAFTDLAVKAKVITEVETNQPVKPSSQDLEDISLDRINVR
jgi:hypothetical protein